jgi:hypothetical protein
MIRKDLKRERSCRYMKSLTSIMYILSLSSWPLRTPGNGILQCPVPKEEHPRLWSVVRQMYYNSVDAAVLNICELNAANLHWRLQ